MLNDEVIWMTYVYEDAQGNPADVDDAAKWVSSYDHGHHPALVDSDEKLRNKIIGSTALPAMWVIDADFTWHTSNGDASKALSKLEELLAE